MRHLAVLLCLLCLSCKSDRLVKARNPLCEQPCYEGNADHAGKGICSMGKYVCADDDSEPVCAGWVGTDGKRLCNGLDNDCDGQLDTTIVSCDTICGTGFQTCSNGRLLNDCTAKSPTAEVCNGRDDDCDGQIDEVLDLPVIPCYTGDGGELTAPYGDCHPGTSKCESGVLHCRNQKLPSPETCDSIDNNCNNLVDEDIPGCVNGGATNDLRIILKRDVTTDLDLHLLHPDAGDSHNKANWSGHQPGLDCFYGERNPEWDNPNDGRDNPSLDHDIIVGTDNETTTITQPIIGHKYTVGIHVFSYAAAPNIVNATVEVYCGGILNATQAFAFDTQGVLWVVGTVEFISQTQCMFTYDGIVLP